ncbi:MAG TPA: galactokinase [Kiritimatiellia bacterium]|nr:galactokinase [Kiritimatiellia bacterium]
MIVTRTPFRITLGGGGTDLPSFYREHGGYVFTMAINKYMYICLNRRPLAAPKIVIRYSSVETVDSIEEIRHPLAREALKLHDVRDHIELTSIADMPAKAGLGSSGSYTVGLLTAIRAYKRLPVAPQVVAEEACHIEIDVLKEPVGKQDQYIAAFGGFQELDIAKDGAVRVSPVPVDFVTVNELVSKARMYYTGIQRSATAVLKAQNEAAAQKAKPDHARVVDNLLKIKALGGDIRQAFADRDMDRFAVLMDQHWMHKRAMSAGISLSVLDQLYDQVKKDYGVLGGKIIGAGGGGFVLLYAPDNGRGLDEYMARHGMPRVSYFPSMQGTKVVTDMSPFDDFDAVR